MALHRQSSNAVLPEPTGPPTPILTGFRIIRTGTAGCRRIGDSSVQYRAEDGMNATARPSFAEFALLHQEDDRDFSPAAPVPAAGPWKSNAGPPKQFRQAGCNRMRAQLRALQ